MGAPQGHPGGSVARDARARARRSAAGRSRAQIPGQGDDLSAPARDQATRGVRRREPVHGPPGSPRHDAAGGPASRRRWRVAGDQSHPGEGRQGSPRRPDLEVEPERPARVRRQPGQGARRSARSRARGSAGGEEPRGSPRAADPGRRPCLHPRQAVPLRAGLLRDDADQAAHRPRLVGDRSHPRAGRPAQAEPPSSPRTRSRCSISAS